MADEQDLFTTQLIRRDFGSNEEVFGADHLSFLAKLPAYLNSTLETTRIVRIGLEHLQSLLSAEMAAAYLLDRKTQALRYWAVLGEEQRRVEGQDLSPEHGLVGAVLKSQFPLIIDNAEKFRGGMPALKEENNDTLKTALAVPIVSKSKKCLGAIKLVNKLDGSEFTSQDMALVGQFCHQISLALDNAFLFEEIKERQEALEKLDQKKSEMISIIAHEFRTPLTIIRNATEMVTHAPESGSGNPELVQLLQASVDRLTKLTTQVRNLSFIQREGNQIRRGRVELQSLFSSLEERYSEVLKGRKLSLRLKDSGLTVIADAALLSIALQNLLTNAIRWTPDGGKIEVYSRSEGEEVRIGVKDNGVGIAEDEQALIFEKFYEVTDIKEHSSGEYTFRSCGLGLGLAAVRHILILHGSSIELESKPKKGSDFFFRLLAVKTS